MKYDDLKRWDYDLWMRVGEIAMIILILSLHPANGQDLSYRQYTVKDGLPGSTVYHALQDQNGFMWFATNQGVSRFDGKAFKNYSKKDGLPDDEVLKLFVDRSNNVWLVSALGIASVIHNDSVTQFTKFPGVIAVAEDVLTDSVYFICKGDNNNGKYYAVYASLNKPDKWNFSGRVRDHYQEWPVLRASSPDKGINFYFLEKEGQGPVLLMKSSSWTTSHSFSCSINGIQRAFDPASFFCLTPDKAGLVFHTFDSLYYIKGNKKLALLPVKDLNMETGIPSVFCENDSTLWVCTRKQGILRIENFLTPQKHFTSFFEKSFCTSIMKDHEGGYWITTHSDGVYYLPNLNFRSLRVSGDIEPKNVKCITVLDQHTAAAGFDDGNVMLVNLKTLRTSLFGDWYTLNRNNRILNIAPYLNDHFLVAGDAGLFKLTRTGQYQKITNLLNAAKDVFVLPDSSIRIALTLGMVSTRPKEGKIFSGRVTCVNGIGTKCYWGTQQGVYTIVNGSPMNLGDKHKELRGIINHLAFAPDSSLWVSTQDGVAVLKDGIVTMIGKELGLPSNTCKHICFDRNTAWVSTNMGICRIDYQWKGSKLKLSISDITEEDGLISNDVNQTTTTEKHVWAATARGITFFDKDFVSQSIIRPLINITRGEAGKKVLAVSDTIILKYPE
ncbi:ligand-binding sensor domain-containing protein, partial [Chryseosolibacter indicus]